MIKCEASEQNGGETRRNPAALYGTVPASHRDAAPSGDAPALDAARLWQDKNPTPPETFRHKGRARSPSAPHHTPVPSVPTPQSTRLLHSSLTGCYTPVQEAFTLQSNKFLYSSRTRLYTPVDQFKHDGRARLQSTPPVAPVKHSLRQGKSNVIQMYGVDA